MAEGSSDSHLRGMGVGNDYPRNKEVRGEGVLNNRKLIFKELTHLV